MLPESAPGTPPVAPVLSPHDTAMLAKVDAAQANLQPQVAPSTPAARPDNIPEKFWDAATGTTRVDELMKSYAELERARGTVPTAPVVPVAPVVPNVPGVDFAAMTAEFTQDGKLSDARYAELAAKGHPKELVDQFIAGQTAQVDVANFRQAAAVTEAHNLAGGAEAFNSMLAWAGANLSPADQDAFDTAVVGGTASRNQAITALKARFVDAKGVAPKLISGEGAATGTGAFQSRAEVTEAMRDPRYRKDPAYRALVERRVGAMEVF